VVSAVLPALIVLALVLLNGLFVAAEFEIVGAPRASLERRSATGDRAARLVARVLGDPRNQDRYIATAQLGITFATLGLGMYGEHMLAEWIAEQLEAWGAARWIAAHTAASVLAIAALTYLHIVLGEMVPKALALQQAERTALAVTPLMLALRVALYPLVIALNGLGNILLRLAGIDRSQPGAERYYSTEELELVVEESLRGGQLPAGTGRVLHELFELGGLAAEDVMAPRVQVRGVRVGATAEEIAELIRERPHTRYVAYEEDLDDVVGVVHVKELAGLAVARRGLDRASVRAVPFVPESAPLESVVRHMRDELVQFVVVLDEFGGTAGIITPDDVTREILGRVAEDDGRPELFEDPSGRLHVAGTVRLDELSERLENEITHVEIETVGGLVLSLLEREARVGDVVEYQGVRLRVTAVEGRGVAETVVERSAIVGQDPID
jgi:CBS domain containing-hemolysin-like protein